MASRVVLKLTKPRSAWGYQGVKGKFGSFGAVRSNRSIVGQHLLWNQSCRHYFLPPPPEVMMVGNGRYCPSFEQPNTVFTLFENESKPPSNAVRFALRMHNDTEGRNIQFRRLVRASIRMHPPIEMEYYLTLEGIDENGYLNVYYADVLHDLCHVEPGLDRSEHGWKLIKFMLLDESFSYPFEETRWKKQFHELPHPDSRINEALGDWLRGIALQYKDKTFVESISGPCTGNSSVFERITNFEKNVRIPDVSPLPSNDDMDDVHTILSDEVVPIYNIMDYYVVIEYASSAVEIYNDKEGKRIFLEEVVCARKAKTNGMIFYFLLLEARDEQMYLNVYNADRNFYYAVIKVLPLEVELIKWQVVDELFSGPPQKDQWEEYRFLLENSMKWPIRGRQDRIEAEILRLSLLGR